MKHATGLLLLLAGLTLAGCGAAESAPKEDVAALQSEVAALKAEVAAVRAEAASTTSTILAAPTTTTTMAPTTTTTTAPAPPPVVEPVPAEVAPPTCSARALASPAVKGTTQTIYVTSNLPGVVADVNMMRVPMDGSGSGQVSFPSTGGTMDQFGHVTPRTAKVKVKFYTGPWTLNDIVDPPFPTTLTECTTTYQAIG